MVVNDDHTFSKRWSLLSNVQGNGLLNHSPDVFPVDEAQNLIGEVTGVAEPSTLTNCTALSAVQVIVYSGRGFGS